MPFVVVNRRGANRIRGGHFWVYRLKRMPSICFESFRTGGESFDTIVLDPPAFAKNRSAVRQVVRGYKEINLRAVKLLRQGGISSPRHAPTTSKNPFSSTSSVSRR